MFQRYVAVGDSFTEGVGDETPDGGVRGWADFVALGLAAASSAPVRYANLAIRGRKLMPLLDEQLEPAIALSPDLLSLNGGGNDILRPSVSIEGIADALAVSCQRVVSEGIHMLLLSGADPTAHLPAGRLIRARGERLAERVRDCRELDGVTFVDNWADATLRARQYWSPDRMHLNAIGHLRVAANVLRALGVPVPAQWQTEAAMGDGVAARRSASYYRHFVLPWIGRRLTGRSSGDGRVAKHPSLVDVSGGESITAAG